MEGLCLWLLILGHGGARSFQKNLFTRPPRPIRPSFVAPDAAASSLPSSSPRPFFGDYFAPIVHPHDSVSYFTHPCRTRLAISGSSHWAASITQQTNHCCEDKSRMNNRGTSGRGTMSTSQCHIKPNDMPRRLTGLDMLFLPLGPSASEP